MGIYLERFSVPKAPKQGVDLHDLVINEREWLEGVFPETFERYRGLAPAAKNVARIAVSKEVQAFIIRPTRILGTAIGIGTVIADQAVVHPEVGRVGGDDLDYWIGPQHSSDTHAFVAQSLMRASAKLALQRHGHRDSRGVYAKHQMFVAVPVAPVSDEIQTFAYNMGLQEQMEMVGQPALIATAGGEDPFGMTRSGEVVQLFARQTIIHRENRFGPLEGI